MAPQPIESKLVVSPLVAQAALVGDRHKFISVLLAPKFTALEEWAQQHGIAAKSRAELVADSRVTALYGEIVRKVNANLANFETLKRFGVVADEWSESLRGADSLAKAEASRGYNPLRGPDRRALCGRIDRTRRIGKVRPRRSSLR